jgi:NADH pyrophosphatase NudC (nudix superfamily)
MDMGAFSLFLLILILVVMFVFWPFIKHWHARVESGHEVSSLLAERDRVLNSIQELDFDNSLGKIPSVEYATQRKALLQTGAEVLRQLDNLRQLSPVDEIKDGEALTGDRFNKADVPTVTPVTDEDLEELIAKRRSIREKTSGFCPNCGKPLLQSDRFCSCCGQAISISPRKQENP